MKKLSRWLACALLVGAGITHLAKPKFFLPIMPPQIPRPEWMIAISGVAEILCGIGMMLPGPRRAARWGTVALLIAVFPANVYMATNGIQPGKLQIPSILLWLRLPLQPLLIWWMLAVTSGSDKKGCGMETAA